MKRHFVGELIGGGTASWARVRKLTRAMSNAELAEAETLERLGRRRENMLMALKAERQRRQGREDKMLRLHVEANL
jgi:hypothetical protein